jgi:uncharacterized membrane protein YqhA
MKRMMRILSLAIVAMTAIPAYAYTLEFDPDTDGGLDNVLQTYTKLGDADPLSIVFVIVNTALLFLGIITLILVIVAGYLWLTAAGTEEKITKAKDIMKGAVVGLVIVLGSYGIAQYVFTAIRIATTG